MPEEIIRELLVRFSKIVPGNLVTWEYIYTDQLLPSHHFNHLYAVSHLHDLFPAMGNKPVISTLIEVFVVIVCAMKLNEGVDLSCQIKLVLTTSTG